MAADVVEFVHTVEMQDLSARAANRLISTDVDLSIENENTRKKTESDLRLFKQFLQEVYHSEVEDHINIETIDPIRLDSYMADFFAVVRKANGTDYEPTSLRSMFRSLNRYLVEKSYPERISESPCFNKTREILKTRRKELKSLGEATGVKKGRTIAARSLSDVEINILYETGQLGTHNAHALANTLWWNNNMYLGLRGGREHRTLCWGDIRLRKDSSGDEFLEYTGKQTKTRSTMKSCSNEKRNPILAYKKFAEKRPLERCTPESAFYLGIDHTTKPSWFTKHAMGKNTLNNLLKNMCKNAGILDEEQRLLDHSETEMIARGLEKNPTAEIEVTQIIIDPSDFPGFVRTFRSLQNKKEDNQIELHNVVLGWKCRLRLGQETQETRNKAYELIETIEGLHDEQDSILEREKQKLDALVKQKALKDSRVHVGTQVGDVEEEAGESEFDDMKKEISMRQQYLRIFNDQCTSTLKLSLVDIELCQKMVDYSKDFKDDDESEDEDGIPSENQVTTLGQAV